MEKQKYEFLKSVKQRLANGQPTEFWERNILNIEEKKARKKKKHAAKKGAEIHANVSASVKQFKNISPWG